MGSLQHSRLGIAMNSTNSKFNNRKKLLTNQSNRKMQSLWFISSMHTCQEQQKQQQQSRQYQLQQKRSQQIYQRVYSMLPLCILIALCSLIQTVHTNPIFVDNPSLAQFQSGRNIRHLPCIVRKSGRSGVCMFAIDCIKQNGTHLGTCIDRFYFGSCCQLKDDSSLFTHEISDNSIDQNTISHFVHESTTLPTSSLFKLTTESSSISSSSSSGSSSSSTMDSGSGHLKNVTQSYLSTNRIETTPSASTSAKPIKTVTSSNTTTTTTFTTKRPLIQHTTHKHSQFVVRTTVKPNTAIKPVGNASGKPANINITTTASTIKPPRRRTTTTKPVLTTATVEQRVESTTAPTKFVTFQIVETTTPTATEATNLDELVTTIAAQPPPPKRTTKPTKIRTTSQPLTASTNRRTTSTSTTTTTTTTHSPSKKTSSSSTARPTPPLRTTVAPSTTTTTTKTTVSSTNLNNTTPHKHKPQQGTHSPATTKKPIASKPRPAIIKPPTRKPAENNNNNGNISTINIVSTTGSVVSKPTPAIIHTIHDENQYTGYNVTKPIERPTHAPRPRPKPTAEVVKVPALMADFNATETFVNTATATTTTTTTAVKVTKKPTTATTASSTTKTTTTTTVRPTQKTTTTASLSLSSTTNLNVTETQKFDSTLTGITSTTDIPGIIIWTDANAEPTVNATIASDWQPALAAADWVPVPTVTPEIANKTTSESNVLHTTANVATSTTEKTIISVATSISSSAGVKPEATTTTTTTVSSTSSAQNLSNINTATATTTPSTTKAPKPTKTAPTLTSTTTTKTTTTTTTPRPITITTTVKPIQSSTTSTTTTTTTTEPNSIESVEVESSTTASGEFGTDNFFGSSTSDYSSGSGSEEYNATLDANLATTTTATPVNSLEGLDYRDVCGRRMFPEPRIVGGANAAFGRWPWQISLRQWRTSTYLHKCGAALLNENWAITAAHCVDNVPPSDLLLRLGEYDLAEEEEPYGYQERRVQIVASHPQFDPRTFEYDLALLRFYEPVVFQPNIIPVCVPENDENFIGQTAFVTGWGRLYEDGPLPSVLQEVAVPVINNTICESMYRTAGYIEHIPHIFICAGWKKGGYDSCEGDSGGPMVLQREKDKRFQLGGVISWGIGCAEANQPGVYTRISEFRDWINQILQF